MLTSRDTAALLQAAALDERRPSAVHEREASGVTRAWSDRALEGASVLDGYLSFRELDRVGLSGLLSGAPWSPHRPGVTWVENVAPWLTHPLVEAERPWHPRRTLTVENTLLSHLPFLAFFGPMVTAQRKFVQGLPGIAVDASADLLDGLGETLASLSLRCLLADMAGDTSPGAYARLHTSLSSPSGRVSFFSRYPVLARDLVTAIAAWRERVRLVTTRLNSDRGALDEAGLPSLGLDALTRVRFAGDPHDGGQSVAVLTFADSQRLVYKPRDCSVFALYRDLTEALSDALPAEARLYAPRALVRDGYGWVEFIEHGGDGRTPATHLLRLGGLLAIAHLLGASDLHLENVIASAAGPVPVDLETLVQNRSHDDDANTAAARAGRRLNESVLGTGILPVQLTAGEGTSIDVSVITGGLQLTETTAVAHRLIDAGTDAMRIEAVELPLGISQNQPPDMTLASVRRHRDHVAEGFTVTSRALLLRRSAVVALFDQLRDLTVRQIVRATRSYSLLLAEMRQPSRLRTGIDRDHLLRSLWTRLADHPEEVDLIGAEDRALRRLDVPLFSTGLDSCSLDAGDRHVAPTYFARTLRQDVIARIESFGSEDIDTGAALIRESISAATTAAIEDADAVHVRSFTVLTPPALRSIAAKQARLLADSAILGRDDATWISVCSSVDSTGLEYRPVGPTLYDGLAGIVLAAAAAHRTLPEVGLDEIAGRGAHAVAAILDDWIGGRVTLPIGAFSGAAGLLYALHRYDDLVGSDRYRVTREGALRRLMETAADDGYLDVMAGAAGAIAVVTAIGDVNDVATATTLRALSAQLVDHAVETEGGALAWESGNSRALLGGFSHGATGIGWALASAASFLGDGNLAEAARSALRFDDQLFDSGRRRWLDARPESLEQGWLFPAHWCHGTAGISLARADAAMLLDDSELMALAEIGAAETASDLPTDDSLCHGTLGNLMALRGIENRGGPGVRDFAERTLGRIGNDGPRSGLPSGVTTVRGLMLGTAGTLYGLCRELDPQLPEILLLK